MDMALINCPECNREISDKVRACPHCGYPFDNIPGIDAIPTRTNDSKRTFPIKVIVPVIVAIAALLIAFIVINITILRPKNIYEKSVNLLESGKYDEAKSLLDEINNYKDVALIQEQLIYESYAYSAISSLKQYLKNPDSFVPYEVIFYYGSEISDTEDEGIYPACIMHYGAQNGFGGNTTGYALFAYDDDKSSYQYTGSCDSLNEEDYDGGETDDLLDLLTCMFINSLQDEGTKVGSINLARLKIVLKNDAYSTIKIID